MPKGACAAWRIPRSTLWEKPRPHGSPPPSPRSPGSPRRACCRVRCSAPHQADPRFNDRDYGPWTGHPKTEVVAEFGSVDAAPGVEARSVVLERVLPALADVVAAGPLVVVTHDAVIRPVLQAIDPTLTDLVVDTASWNQLERVGDAWVVRSTDNKPAAP